LLKQHLLETLTEEGSKIFAQQINEYLKLGVPVSLANELVATRYLFSALDVVEIANDHAIPVTKVATVYFAIGDYLDLNWLRLQIITHTSKNHWESLTREALRDDLSLQQRLLTIAILQYNRKSKQTHIESWAEKYASLVERWCHMLDKLRTTSVLGYTMFFVAIRELSDLTQASAQAVPELSQRKSPKKKT